jgi:enediyne biosynthesis thioesterase
MAPEVLAELAKDLRLVTTRCTCEYFQELHALEEVVVRMRLGSLMQNRITMEFEYYRSKDGKEELVAKGEQQVACMRVQGQDIVPTPVPEALREGLRPYSVD